MKNASMNRHPFVSIFRLMFLVFGISGILLTSLLLASCGGDEEPTETTITGIKQNTTVSLTFDDDPGDVRVNDGIVEGSGNERTISQFSHEPLELTISWSNKDATIIRQFTETIDRVETTITVGTPPPPLPEPPLNSLGDCAVGMILKAGQSCTYPGTNTPLSVHEDGTAMFLFATVGGDIVIENANINGKRYTLVAVKRDDGSREIIKVGE